jgi:hypothetical protein
LSFIATDFDISKEKSEESWNCQWPVEIYSRTIKIVWIFSMKFFLSFDVNYVSKLLLIWCDVTRTIEEVKNKMVKFTMKNHLTWTGFETRGCAEVWWVAWLAIRRSEFESRSSQMIFSWWISSFSVEKGTLSNGTCTLHLRFYNRIYGNIYVFPTTVNIFPTLCGNHLFYC